MPSNVTIGLIIIAVLLVIAYPAFVFNKLVQAWARLFFWGAPVPLLMLLGQRLRGAPIEKLARWYIALRKAGLNVSMAMLETHHGAGGDVENVVRALIAADRARVPMSFEFAAAVDLAPPRRDMTLEQAISELSHPKVLKAPQDLGVESLEFVTQNGDRLEGHIVVTCRPSLERFVGGADAATLVGRVAGAVSALVNSFDTAEDAIRHMADLGRDVMDAPPDAPEAPNAPDAPEAPDPYKADAGTAYEILAIDVLLRQTRAGLASSDSPIY